MNIYTDSQHTPSKRDLLSDDPATNDYSLSDSGIERELSENGDYSPDLNYNTEEQQDAQVYGYNDSIGTLSAIAPELLHQRPPSPARRPITQRRTSHNFRKKVRNPETNNSVMARRASHDLETMLRSGSVHSVIHSVPENADREYVSIHDDVYNLFFLSNIGGHAFFYSLYVFALKMALYTFLAIDVMAQDRPHETDKLVLAAQFLMLPVAVAMQDDLTATYYLIANVKYCESVKTPVTRSASAWKFHVATLCRAIDGIYSLLVNFLVLVTADHVLSLFLNFAALQFLQTIDNIALELAADGYLTDRLEVVAQHVKSAQLPKRSDDNWMRALDTVLFLSTVVILFVMWVILAFHI